MTPSSRSCRKLDDLMWALVDDFPTDCAQGDDGDGKIPEVLAFDMASEVVE